MANTKTLLSLSLVLALFVIASCSSTSVKRPETLSKDNYHGYYKVGAPYQIDGKWYRPREQPDYDETGMASWYGSEFNGKKTANGDTFDKYSLTAAHNTLPLPSMVRVTNLESNKTLIVMVNDRGPFSKNRIIDLSERSAEILGFKNKGTAKVRVQFLPGQTQRLLANLPGVDGEKKRFSFLSSSDPVYAEETPLSMSGASEDNAPKQELARELAKADIAKEPKSDLPKISIDETPKTATKPEETKEAPFITPEHDASMTEATPAASSINEAAEGLADAVEKSGDATAESWDAAKDSEKAIKLAKADAIQAGNLDAAMEKITDNTPQHFVQAGTYSLESNAMRVEKTLRPLGDVSVAPIMINNKKLYKVRVGPISDKDIAQVALEKVIKLGHPDARLVSEVVTQ